MLDTDLGLRKKRPEVPSPKPSPPQAATRYDREVSKVRRLEVPHPPAFDVAFMVALLIISVLEDLVFPFRFNDQISGRDPDILALVFLLIAVLPLTWRRTNPIPVFFISAIGFFGRFLLGYSLVTGVQLTALITVYTVGAYAPRPAANTSRWVAVAVVAIGFSAGLLLGHAPVFVVAIMAINWFGFGVFGEIAHTRRQYQLALEDRATLLERDQEQRAERGVLEERARIARDLHDVLAHTMSLIVVQAGAAEEVLDTRPDLARQSLITIRHAGRGALDEIRRIVAAGDGAGVTRGLAPGISDLSGLVEDFRKVGLPIAFELAEPFADIPEDASLTVFRIVQQALTNALTHGGPGVAVTARVRRSGDGVTVLVEDDGLGSAAVVRNHVGRGLIGMRERVSTFGGTVSAGPIPAGGFRVEARIPIGVSE